MPARSLKNPEMLTPAEFQVLIRELDHREFGVVRWCHGRDGLFYMLARQEAEIRTNPVARSTALLKQVFGAH